MSEGPEKRTIDLEKLEELIKTRGEDYARLMCKRNHFSESEANEAIAKLATIPPTRKRKTDELITQLKDNDTTLAPPELVQRFADKLKLAFPPADLERLNAELRKRSGSITYEDVAFVAIIHRHSVQNNGFENPIYQGTSPFSRIANASSTFVGRNGKKLDNRQIRYALTILEDVSFTTETCSSQHYPSYIETSKRGTSTASIWTISDSLFWTSIFDQK